MLSAAHRLFALQLVLVGLVAGAVDRVRTDQRERGVVSVEYVVLGAALIVIIGVVATNTGVSTAISNAFTRLFDRAAA